MKITIKINQQQANKVLNSIPKGCSITLRGKDLLKILDKPAKGK